jgi:ribose 5-phosphate isomerase B
LITRFPNLPWKDLGPGSTDSVDYPDFAAALCEQLKPEIGESLGVLICGSGQGMAMKANRYPHIRAALCWSEEITRLARQHNDANVLCLPGRHLVFQTAMNLLNTFLETEFEGGRHQRRVDKLSC